MSIRDLIPVRRRPGPIVRRSEALPAWDAFHHEIDRLFDGLFEEFGLPAPWQPAGSERSAGRPAVNIAESDTEVTVTAELPGVEEKDLSLELDGDRLTLRGETRRETEHKDRRWTTVEHVSGSFHRVVQLPAEVREEGAKASFRRGILTVTLPKVAPQDAKRKLIPIEV